MWLCGRLAGGAERPSPPKRPTAFKTAPGDGAALALLRRERSLTVRSVRGHEEDRHAKVDLP